METGILILAMAAVAFIMHWLVKNDGAPTIADQEGLLRMTPPADEASRDAEERRRRASTVNRRPS